MSEAFKKDTERNDLNDAVNGKECQSLSFTLLNDANRCQDRVVLQSMRRRYNAAQLFTPVSETSVEKLDVRANV
jgi:hypothetical protein